MTVAFTSALEAIRNEFPRKPEHLQRFWAGRARDAAEQGSSFETFIAGLKSAQAKSAAADRALRAALRARFDRYRITITDQVEVYGVMPHSRQVGWYSYGDRKEAARRIEEEIFDDR